jgi:hypothetical protein
LWPGAGFGPGAAMPILRIHRRLLPHGGGLSARLWAGPGTGVPLPARGLFRVCLTCISLRLVHQVHVGPALYHTMCSCQSLVLVQNGSIEFTLNSPADTRDLTLWRSSTVAAGSLAVHSVRS